MDQPTDRELLDVYATQASEPAFAALLGRHLDLVYATAHRVLGDPHLAEDVAQSAFVALAENAGRLTRHPSLAAWLHRTTRNLALNTLRSRTRRQTREQQAAPLMLASPVGDGDPEWHSLAAHLDGALDQLGADDRAALLARYYQGRSARDVAAQLGVSEAAAHKRIHRALGRLRTVLAGHAVTVGAPRLAAALLENAVPPAPAGLAAAIQSAVAAHTAAATAGLLATQTLAMNSASKAALALLLALTFTLAAYHCLTVAELRRELASAHARLAGSRVANSPSENAPPTTDEAAEFRRRQTEHLELLRLRDRVTELSDALRRATRDRSPTPAAGRPLNPAEAPPDSGLFTASLTNRVPYRHTLVLGGWSRDGKRGYLAVTPTAAEKEPASAGDPVVFESVMLSAPDAFWSKLGWAEARSGTRQSSLAGLLTPDQFERLLTSLQAADGTEISNRSAATNFPGRPMGFAFSEDDPGGPGLLVGIDLSMHPAPDGMSVDLEIRPGQAPPETLHSSLR